MRSLFSLRRYSRLWRRIEIALLLVLAGTALYLWHGRIQAERALEDASLEELQRITAQRPGYARAFHHLGLRLGKARQYQAAFEAHSRAADLAPDDEVIWTATAAAANAAHGQEAAFAIMNDFLKRHPESKRMREERESLLGSLRRAAEGFAAQKSYTEAIRFYKQWLAQDPTSGPAQQGLALTLLAAGKKEEAFSALDEAVRQHPDLPEARMALAEMYAEAGFIPNAVAHLKALTQIAPTNVHAWLLLGRLTSGSDPITAESAFENAVRNAPDNALAHLDLAAMQALNNKPEKAEATYRKALELAPKDPMVLAQTGGFLASGRNDPERRKQAQQLLKAAVALRPEHGDAYYHLGRLALERREYREAVRLLQSALARPLNEDSAAVWYALAQAYQGLGDKGRATEALRKSRKIRDDRFALARAEEMAYNDPRDPRLRLKVARLYAQQGAYLKALSQYEGCLLLAPNNAVARKELEELSSRLKARGQLPPMALFHRMAAAASRTQ